MRKFLAAAVALAPLCMVASAHADDTIGGGTKGPVLTSAQGNITINSGGSVDPGTLTSQPAACGANQPAPAAGCPLVGVFLDGPSTSVAAPTVTNNGTIGNTSLSKAGGATGILIQGGATAGGPPTKGVVANNTTIQLSDGFSPPTNNTTGLVYGLWSNTTSPQNNYGIRLIGPGGFQGSISTASGSAISVAGNNSYGISIEAPLDATTSSLTLPTVKDAAGTPGTSRVVALELGGGITVMGDNAVGVNIAGPIVKGASQKQADVLLQGTISATGQKAVGLQTSQPIDGRLTIGSAISSTGYHYTTRPIDSTIKLFDQGPYTQKINGQSVNTETLQGGSAVIVGGSVTGGILLDAEPVVTTTTTTSSSGSTTTSSGTTSTDVDLDGIPDASQTTGSIASFGQAPALVIGSTTQAITLGPVGTTQTATGAAALYDYGLILKGNVTANGVYDFVPATAVQIGGTLTQQMGGQVSTQLGTADSGSSQSVTIGGGGILNNGAISATTYQATATALLIGSGVSMPGGTINTQGGITNIGGTIVATSNTSGIHAATADEQNEKAVAISIEAGANVPSIRNDVGSSAGGGGIGAATASANGTATAIVDKSGSLKSIVNSGSITALTDVAPGTTPLDESPQTAYTGGVCSGAVGCAIAIDASTSNSTGITIVQQQSAVTGASAPTIIGDVYLPSATTAHSVMTIAAGSVTGTVNLGGGAVQLTVGSGSTTTAVINGPLVYGATSAATSQLDINVLAGGVLNNGVLSGRTITPQAIYANTVNVNKGGLLFAAVDPLNPTQTGYIANSADLQAGAKLGVNFTNMVPVGETVLMNYLQAPNLNIEGAVDESAIVHPFLFNTLVGTAAGGDGLDTVANCGTGQICVEASQKTAQQAGMNEGQAGFYNGAYRSLSVLGSAGGDTDLTDLFLGKTTKADFFRDYNQLSPVAGGATLLSLSSGMRSISRALTDTRPVALPGETTGWAQEINFYADHSENNSLGFRTHGIGVASGMERGTAFGAFGVSAAFTSGDMKTPSQIGASDLGATAYEIGPYWRYADNNGIRAWARVAAGYATFNSTRDFIDNPVEALTQTSTSTTTSTNSTTGATTNTTTTNITEATALTRTATGNWSGYTLAGGGGLSWEHHFMRRFYIRPEVNVEYMRLQENGYTENNASGGVNGIPLIVSERIGHILTTSAMLNLGGRFGDVTGQGGITAELQAGYRDNVSADPGLTTIQFVNNKGVFSSIAGDTLTGGGPVIGFRLMAGGPMGYVALEGDAEDMQFYTEYVLLLRAAFRF